MNNTIKKEKIGMDMTEGAVMKTLLLFSMPLIAANLLQEFYSMVDLMVIGQFAGSVGTVGVSTGGEIADILTPAAMALAAAGQIYIAQLAGAGEEKRIKEAVGTLLSLMLGIAVVFSFLIQLFCPRLLNLLNCPQEAMSEAVSYLRITALGIPFIFGYNGICGLLRGMGESKKPLVFIMIAAAVNIFLDLLLVAVFHMGTAGTAIATVLAQIGACAAAFAYLYLKREQFDFEWRLSYFKIRRNAAVILLRLAIPRIFQSCCIRFSLLWCNSNINSYGMIASAANSIGNKLQKISTTVLTAVDTGSGAMIGQNIGARKTERVKKIVLSTLAITLTAATIASAFALLCPRKLFGIFTMDKEVMELGVTYLKIMVITFYLAALLGTFQAVVTGVGFASFGFAIGMLDGVVCRIGFSLFFVYVLDWGVKGFFMGHAMARLIPFILSFLYYISGRWKKRKLLIESS